MSKTTQSLLYWFTHINIGAALGIVAFLVYSIIQTVFINQDGRLAQAPSKPHSNEVRK
jgi:hypothetical protein